MELANGLDEDCARKTGVKNSCKMFCLEYQSWNCHFLRQEREWEGSEDLMIDVFNLRCLSDLQMDMLSRQLERQIWNSKETSRLETYFQVFISIWMIFRPRSLVEITQVMNIGGKKMSIKD